MKYTEFDPECWSLAAHCTEDDYPYERWCGAGHDGWVCTRVEGHRGRHEGGTYATVDGFTSIGAVWTEAS